MNARENKVTFEAAITRARASMRPRHECQGERTRMADSTSPAPSFNEAPA